MGIRNRKTWNCRPCSAKLYSRKAWVSHLWDKHKLAVPRKIHFNKAEEKVNGGRAP